MSNTIIQASNLTKAFGKTMAVKGIDLAINRGEIFGLVGPDGAGKSTTLRLLCGLLTPTEGAAAVAGRDVIRRKDYVNPRIAYISEGLYETLSVKENIDFFARLRKVPREEARDRQKELLAFSGLEPYAGRRAEHLSGGMKKKLALCCALIHHPEVLFLDEPTTGIDPLSRRELWKILLRYQARGVTICLSTPYMDEAEKCDRLVLLYDGKIVGSGTPDQLKEQVIGDCLELTLAGPWRALELLKDQPGIRSGQVLGNTVRLAVDEAARRIPEIEAALERNGSADGSRTLGTGDGATTRTGDSSFSRRTPTKCRRVPFSMEDAFIALMGAAEAESVPFEPPPSLLRKAPGNGKELTVEVSDLTKKFDSFVAVDKVSFGISRGEIFGFLGPNGAGKSTTIRMLCGILSPSSGGGKVLGYDIAREAEKLKPEVGYMSQRFSLYKDLTVQENIDFYSGLYRVASREKRDRKEWVLKMAGLQGVRNTLAGDLAGGWKQRLALMCAFLHGPRIVFLDEPTSGMDPISRRRCWAFLNNISALGITICVSTHYMDEAEYCQELGLLHHGRLAALGTPFDLKNMLGRAQATMEDVFVALTGAGQEA